MLIARYLQIYRKCSSPEAQHLTCNIPAMKIHLFTAGFVIGQMQNTTKIEALWCFVFIESNNQIGLSVLEVVHNAIRDGN